VRRTGRDSAASFASGHEVGSIGRQPSRRSGPSKPDRTRPRHGRDAAAPPPLGIAAAADLASGLYLVATPIGNLGDITVRALEILRGVDRIFCEDTRVTARLLARYGIKKPLARYDDHSAPVVRPAILAGLRAGERLALVADAGTPLVSDPGYKLVRTAIAEQLRVTAAPGPSAALTALILSGLPPDVFLFSGFLPARRAARRRVLMQRAALDATLIFFESAPRLAFSLTDMAELLGRREAAVARELTKFHEEVRRAPLDELVQYYRAAGPPRGEAVIVVGPPEPLPPEGGEIEARLAAAVGEFGVREAAVRLAAETGLARRELYCRALAIAAGRK
jgi:16S rRNA (cytidine1402-2'-O)-methyltransferase